MALEETRRRPLLKAVVGGVGALGAIAVGARLTTPGERAPAGLQLSSTGSQSDIKSLEVRLGDDLLPSVGSDRWRSAQLPTSTHSMVAVAWRAGGREPRVDIRSRREGAWGPWMAMPILHDAPDRASSEGGRTTGTDLMWVGDSDGIQVKVQGQKPRRLTLVLLHPGRWPGDLALEAPPDVERERSGLLARRARSVVQKPAILRRRDWGANEKLRNSRPRFNRTLKQVHIHHTVNGNDYARDDVAGLIRGIYHYHTATLGWSDVGYNFLVDRFGRIWAGRAGGVARLVQGAHTRGFNAESTGIAVIGNFELTRPSAKTLNAIAQLAAWKLSAFDLDPAGRTSVVSEGSDKFSLGRRLQLPVIDGHRDTNDTACPGRYLYAALPGVRRQATAMMADSGDAPTVSLRTVGRRRRAVVHVNVASANGSPATGQVTVWIRGRRRTKALESGRATARFVKLGRGEHSVLATYVSSDRTKTRERSVVRVR